jgi:hypothetical protein
MPGAGELEVCLDGVRERFDREPAEADRRAFRRALEGEAFADGAANEDTRVFRRLELSAFNGLARRRDGQRGAPSKRLALQIFDPAGSRDAMAFRGQIGQRFAADSPAAMRAQSSSGVGPSGDCTPMPVITIGSPPTRPGRR